MNLVLEEAEDVTNAESTKKLGTIIVRGDNVVNPATTVSVARPTGRGNAPGSCRPTTRSSRRAHPSASTASTSGKRSQGTSSVIDGRLADLSL